MPTPPIAERSSPAASVRTRPLILNSPLLDIMKLRSTLRTSSVLNRTRTGPQKVTPTPLFLRKFSSTEATACTSSADTKCGAAQPGGLAR